MVVPVHQAAKMSAGKVSTVDMIVVSLSQSFVSVTRVHYAFEDFDNTECSADLFYRNTDIWTMGDVCPAPKIWVPYTPPDYSTYEHQSLPNYVRGKRQSNGKDCVRNTGQENSGCATDGNFMSLSVEACNAANLYTSEKLKSENRNKACCQFDLAKNAFRTGFSMREEPAFKAMFKNVKAFVNDVKQTCCKLYKGKTTGVDALTYCPKQQLS